MDDRTHETPHRPHLRMVGGSMNPEPDTEANPPIPPRNPAVEMILEDLCTAAIASTASADPAHALRIALHHAYEQLFAVLPKNALL